MDADERRLEEELFLRGSFVSRVIWLSAAWFACVTSVGAWAERSEAAGNPSPYFRVRVIDEATGRGVPLVRLQTVDNIVYVTDSAGMAAIDEPGLMGQKAWFGRSEERR